MAKPFQVCNWRDSLLLLPHLVKVGGSDSPTLPQETEIAMTMGEKPKQNSENTYLDCNHVIKYFATVG